MACVRKSLNVADVFYLFHSHTHISSAVAVRISMVLTILPEPIVDFSIYVCGHYCLIYISKNNQFMNAWSFIEILHFCSVSLSVASFRPSSSPSVSLDYECFLFRAFSFALDISSIIIRCLLESEAKYWKLWPAQQHTHTLCEWVDKK